MIPREPLVNVLAALSVAAAVAGCAGAAPTAPDPELASLSQQAQAALATDADLLVPVRHIMEAYREGVQIVFADARTRLDYDYGHIPGAVHVPYFDPIPYLGELPRDRLIVAYCECPHAEAVQVAEALLENGFRRVKVIDEGLAGWTESGGVLQSAATGGG